MSRTTPTAERPVRRPSEPGRYHIAVLAKALDLLDLLDAEDGLTLTELSGRAGINKATALRILANLDDRGYVERDGNGRYRLGVRLMQLGARKSAGLDLRSVARPILQRLQAETGETVNLGVPTAEGVIYIDILESAHGLRMAATVGANDEYHSTALGKAIMAHWAAPAFADHRRRRPLTPKTPRTIVDGDTLERELAAIRTRGFALDDEENEVGARCVAAAILDHRDQVVGAVSVSGPASRLTRTRCGEIAPGVVAASRQISAMMGLGTAEAGRRDGETGT
ncbi:MAG: IclR family transcriptional regulator [Thermomicrobiales bacterium]